jgi:hypothetical protein
MNNHHAAPNAGGLWQCEPSDPGLSDHSRTQTCEASAADGALNALPGCNTSPQHRCRITQCS